MSNTMKQDPHQPPVFRLIGILDPWMQQLIAAAPDEPIPAPPPMPLSSRTLDRKTGFFSEYRAEWNRPVDPVWKSGFSLALQTVRKGGMVAMVGPRGTGKTQMSAEVARDYAPESARYAVWRSFYARLLACGRKDTETEYDALQELANAKLLVIDELHEKYGSDAAGTEREARTLTTIIDQRYGNRKPVILISNEAPESFLASLPDSVYDRFRQIGEAVRFSGPSHRGKLRNAQALAQPGHQDHE